MCCRAHDNCEDTIAGGGTKHNLENDASYTRYSFLSRLSCSCDLEFQKCLLSADTAMSEFIGMTYFDGLQTKCFKKEYPITKCLQYGGWFNEKCLEYELDESGTPTYQWFDVPMFGK
ncbi:phospholipase A2-like [Trichoplusia ni]|uniref:phospholipase A2 n=1 Tax=Trichoplusia ni TaxID=7111 RepID=A0A7E5W9V1_TRINI|nr:phospholipase A2-like [Trichoplusia ni]